MTRCRMGLPATSISALGRDCVSAPTRCPRPPARMATFIGPQPVTLQPMTASPNGTYATMQSRYSELLHTNMGVNQLVQLRPGFPRSFANGQLFSIVGTHSTRDISLPPFYKGWWKRLVGEMST